MDSADLKNMAGSFARIQLPELKKEKLKSNLFDNAGQLL